MPVVGHPVFQSSILFLPGAEILRVKERNRLRNPVSRSGCGPLDAAEESAIPLLRLRSNVRGESLFPAPIGSNCSSQINRFGELFRARSLMLLSIQTGRSLFSIHGDIGRLPQGRTQSCFRNSRPPDERCETIGNTPALSRRPGQIVRPGQTIVRRVRKALR